MEEQAALDADGRDSTLGAPPLGLPSAGYTTRRRVFGSAGPWLKDGGPLSSEGHSAERARRGRTPRPRGGTSAPASGPRVLRAEPVTGAGRPEVRSAPLGVGGGRA